VGGGGGGGVGVGGGGGGGAHPLRETRCGIHTCI